MFSSDHRTDRLRGALMNPSYCRIRIPKDEALQRFADWNHLPQIGPLAASNSMEAVHLACDERGMWRGHAIFISERSGWTLFHDLSGCLGAIPAEKWRDFAQADDLVFAGYNDAIRYGELIAISGGSVIREFVDSGDASEPEVNIGRLESERDRFKTWIDVATFVDEDKLAFSDSGASFKLMK